MSKDWQSVMWGMATSRPARSEERRATLEIAAAMLDEMPVSATSRTD